jgi:hypothetical protein
MTLRWIPCAVVAIVMLRSANAAAKGGEVEFDDRPFNVQLRLGFGSSVGVSGLVGEVDLDDRINIGAGAGTNLRGAIVGAHVRLRPLVFRTSQGGAAHAIPIEAAVSRSRYSGALGDGFLSDLCEGAWNDPKSRCYDPPITAEWVWWGQIETGWEFRHRSGLSLRATTGVAWLLATPNWQCTIDGAPVPCGHRVPSTVLPGTFTFSVGYSF